MSIIMQRWPRVGPRRIEKLAYQLKIKRGVK